MKKPKGSHGIYFVVRLPDRWQLVAFPFDSHERFAIYHGDNLKPTMKVTRKAVEKAFGLTSADWEFDDHEQCSNFSAEALRSALGIRDVRKTTKPDFS